MKTLNEKFTDEEHRILLKSKGNMTWHDAIMQIAKVSDVKQLMASFPHPRDVDASADYAEDLHQWYDSMVEALHDE